MTFKLLNKQLTTSIALSTFQQPSSERSATASMGGSRIFDWGGPRIDEARDACKNVAIIDLKSWPIEGGAWPCGPPGTALDGFSFWHLLQKGKLLTDVVVQSLA